MERRHELTRSHRHTCARGRHLISMRGKWCLMRILDFFNTKTLLQLLLAQKLISSKCVLFKNNSLPSDTVPLITTPRLLAWIYKKKFHKLARISRLCILSWITMVDIIGRPRACHATYQLPSQWHHTSYNLPIDNCANDQLFST